jgi:hypothetical protein
VYWAADVENKEVCVQVESDLEDIFPSERKYK